MNITRRCAAYNQQNGTDYSPEAYEEARTRVPAIVAFDEGYSACESSVLLCAALFRQEAKELETASTEKAKGASIAYLDMADQLEKSFS
jgi:hypothetical protein